MESSTRFTVTLNVETRHAVAVDLLIAALADVAALLLMKQRLNVVLERALNAPNIDPLWRFHVRGINIALQMPEMPQ